MSERYGYYIDGEFFVDPVDLPNRLEMQMKVVREWIEAGKGEYDCDRHGWNINLHQYVIGLEKAIDNAKS